MPQVNHVDSLYSGKKIQKIKYKLWLISGFSIFAVITLCSVLYVLFKFSSNQVDSIRLQEGASAPQEMLYEMTGLLLIIGTSVSIMFFIILKYLIEPITNENQKLEERVHDMTGELTQKIQDLNLERQKNREVGEKTLFERAKDEAVLASIGHGVVTIDKKGNITFFNKAAEILTNWKAEEVIGKPWFETVPEMAETKTLVSREGRAVFKALKTGHKIITSTVILQRGSGKIPVVMTATPVIFNGETIGAVGVFRDVTHERNVDRMKTEFISLASHQLRTPLSAIKWFCEMLLNGDAGELNPEQKEYTQNVSDSSERMIDLVNSLLNISRIESGRIVINPKPTDINKLISEVITEIKINSDQKKQKIIVSVHSDVPLIKIDPRLMREVYGNLLTNASKYAPPGGEISVLISKKGEELISQVSDNGYGILKKDYDKIFQKFYRGENIIKIETDGNGLGLYLVKAIIESSGGKIWFESAENKGTTFYFSLPLGGMQAKEGEVTLDS